MISLDSINRNISFEGRKIEALSKLSELVEARSSEDEICAIALELLVQLFGAERGAIFLWDVQKDHLQLKKTFPCSFEKDQVTIADAKELSHTSALSAMEDGEVIYTNKALLDERFASRQSVVLNKIQALLCAPLKVGGEVIGAIYLDSRKIESLFTQIDCPFFKVVTKCVASAIANYRECKELSEIKGILENRNKQELIGSSEAMVKLCSQACHVASSNSTVLIIGESGTGKDLLARKIHERSPRQDKKFVIVDCGALSETLLASELFGHKKGAFTGAVEDKAGLLEEADSGTVFVDEVCSASLEVQKKLLRFLQEGEIRRLGENKLRKVDVRVICSTNKDIEHQVERGLFREDLYFRLKVITLKVPPLRERGGDIILLAEHFRKLNAALLGKPVRGFTREAMKAMLKASWPGNVRELQHAVERAVLMCEGQYVSEQDLELSTQFAKGKSIFRETLETQKLAMVKKALEESKGNITKAATILGMAPKQLNRIMKHFGISGPTSKEGRKAKV